MTDEAKIAQQRTHIQATDTPARHGGSSAAEARADQSDAASGLAQARGVAPAPAQGLEAASGGHSTTMHCDVCGSPVTTVGRGNYFIAVRHKACADKMRHQGAELIKLRP